MFSQAKHITQLESQFAAANLQIETLNKKISDNELEMARVTQKVKRYFFENDIAEDML